MSPAWIRPRTVKVTARNPRGRSFQVLFRRGGRGYRIETAGTFKTEKEARTRCDLVRGWLAGGQDPATELAKLATPPAQPRTFAQAAESMIRNRHGMAANTVRSYHKAIDKTRELRPDLLTRPPAQWSVTDAQELLADMIDDGLAPASVKKYVGNLNLVFDHDGAESPFRDRRVTVPAQVKATIEPPSAAHVVAMLERVQPARLLLPLIVAEQTAMRVSEIATLPWGDVDVAGCRFRLARERVKTRHPRWVQVPEWLMAHVADSCPLEDRLPDRRVFLTSDSALRNAMARACRMAGIPLYSPHDLRHRRASLWHGQGVSTRELMDRGGWSRSDVAIDTYTHLMPVDEVSAATLEGLLA